MRLRIAINERGGRHAHAHHHFRRLRAFGDLLGCCKVVRRHRAASHDNGYYRLRHPLVFSCGREYVGWRIPGRLLVPRRTSDLSCYISIARRGGHACELENLMKRDTVIDTDTSDKTPFVIRATVK